MLIDLVPLASVSLELYMKDKSAVELYFIGIWGAYMAHPQNSGLDRYALHTQIKPWMYDGGQFLYANNDYRGVMEEARKIYHNLLARPACL